MIDAVAAAALLAGCSYSRPAAARRPAARPERVAGGPSGTYVVPPGIHKIKHVIIVMQENRSFDSYFGTYPGADGIPMRAAVPTVCVPNPVGGCTRPYHDIHDVNGGGPHAESNAVADVASGRMTGFIHERYVAQAPCGEINDPARSGVCPPTVLGTHAPTSM